MTSSTSHDITPLPAISFNPSKISQIDEVSLQGKDTNEYSQIADQLAVSVEEQAKILADIEREKGKKSSLNRPNSSSSSILTKDSINHIDTNLESGLNLSQSNIKTSIGHIKETSRSVPDRSDELDILAKYLPSYTESLTEKEVSSKKTKKASLVDRYLNPSLSQEINLEESPDPEMPTLQPVSFNTTTTSLENKSLIDFGPPKETENFYETLKNLKTPFSQSSTVNGPNDFASAESDAIAGSLISFEDTENSYKRVKEIKAKYQEQNSKCSVANLIDIESTPSITKQTSSHFSIDRFDSSIIQSSSAISSEFSIAKDFASSIDEQAKILAEIEKEKEKKASSVAPTLMKTKSKSNLKSSIKRSKSRGRNVTFDETASKTSSRDETMNDWSAVVSSTQKTFNGYDNGTNDTTNVAECQKDYKQLLQFGEKEKTYLNKTTRSASNNDLHSYPETNHDRPKRNREKSPTNTEQSTSRPSRKSSVSEYPGSSLKTKVKERSNSLCTPRSNGLIARTQQHHQRNGEVAGDSNKREALRQLLCDLRKDAMDDDLENNDGTFFPCEFCGDPYPVEYLMRHQVRKY